jgi:predicted nucleic acid-binding protein
VVGTTTGAATDIDGKFSFRIEAGTYALEARSIGYRTKRVEGIIAKPNDVALISISLESSDLQTEEVEIVANLAKNNESNLLQDQRAATGINSGVSAELLAKTPDRSVAESFKRISGASIREGKFAVVRGLQEAMAHPMHRFWPDAINPLAAGALDWQRLMRPAEITDAYLLALAVHHQACLVTLDQGISLDWTHGASDANLQVLV